MIFVRSYEDEEIFPEYLYSEEQSILIESDIVKYHDIINELLAGANHRQDISNGIYN